MVLLNCKTVLKNIKVYDSEKFQLNQKYLWIWNPTSIPPHMGLSVDGAYFSLKSNGVDWNTDLRDIIGVIERKNLTVLAIQLKEDFDVDSCKDVFSNYEKTIPGEVTCLRPIKSVLNQNSPQKLSELLEELESLNALGEVTAWNYASSELELPEYSTEDIHTYLNSLSK